MLDRSLLPWRNRPAGAWPVGRLAALAGICMLAACGTHADRSAYRGGGHGGAARYYPPPGTPDDPWGPYVREASARFSVPDRWIREVMRQESGGLESAVSSAGAIGLMQVMPDTYDGLRNRYGLGRDPYDPHDNVLAGTAYIKEMYDVYGAPGFLAAYNAGPNRLDQYLTGGISLPDETVNYVASIAPRLAGTATMTGPLAVYVPVRATDAQISVAQSAPLPRAPSAIAGVECDPDAAYDPDGPCVPMPTSTHSSPAAAMGSTPAPPVLGVTSSIYQPPPALAASSASPPSAAFARLQTVRQAIDTSNGVSAAPRGESRTSGEVWAVQVGAFADPVLARNVALAARGAAPASLGAAGIAMPETTPFGGTVLYRARLTGLSPGQASDACAALVARQIACMVVPPRGS